MRKLLCGNNSIEWGELIKNKQTFILDCSGMSKEKMIFIGTVVSHGIASYFRFSRPDEYYPLSLYMDEAHNFVTPGIFDILKEGRKYKISCVLATQDFAVLDERSMRVMLNVGNIVSYKLGHREASYVVKELGIETQKLQFIEKYHVYYMTPNATGKAKAPRPPFIKAKALPKRTEPQRKSGPSWFTPESCPPA